MSSGPNNNDNESRPKRCLLYAKGVGTLILAGIAAPIVLMAIPLVLAYWEVEESAKHQIKRGKTAVNEYKWRRFLRKHKLPPSQPLVNNNNSSSSNPQITSDKPRKVGFLDLPIEIRLEIYRLVLPPKCVFQPGQKLKMNNMYSRYGPLPSRWEASQYIRSDKDPPSITFATLLAIEHSSFRKDEFPPLRTGSRGRSTTHCPPRLILTNEEAKLTNDTPLHDDDDDDDDIWEKRHYTNLMRTCRFIYEEVLGLLYGNNTISFFGSESVPFFVRNASPEGLMRIRYAHLALSIQSQNWSMPRNKQSVLDAVQCLNNTSTMAASLRQLDVEIVLTHGQPSEPQQFWAWLMKTLSCLRDLDRFVLKVSVLRADDNNISTSEEDERREELEMEELFCRFLAGEWYLRMLPRRTRLVTWNESEYEMLKSEVTRGHG